MNKGEQRSMSSKEQRTKAIKKSDSEEPLFFYIDT
jgi:hypothetical protein